MDNLDDHHEYCQGGFDPEDIVITGVAGRFPECDNVGELFEGLLNKKNLIVYSDARYEKGAYKLPFSSGGIISGLDKFDADFFRLPYITVQGMEPGTRKVLEVSYEALCDSGYDPSTLRGANIGVYNATTHDDNQLFNISCKTGIGGFSWLRCLKANRVSYIFDFLGPSLSLDTACSSSAVATWVAVQDLIEGKIEAALVNSSQLDMHPSLTATYLNNGIGSPTGINSMPFDANSDGMNRTEAVAAIFIQKAKNSRRVYAKVCSSRFVTSGYVPEGVSVPSLAMQIKVSKDILRDAGLKPDDVDYFEAHGTGTSVGDPIELNSIASVYCEKPRKKPFYVGSVKSNIGHTEASSGLCGIIKALISLEYGKVLPNYRYFTPNPSCPELVEGKIRVVTEPLPIESPYIPINSFGLAGTIVQVLLKQNPNTLENSKTVKSKIPKMVLNGATCESAVQRIFDYVRDNPDLPEEFYALLHKLSFTPTLLRPIRGFAFFQDPSNPIMDIKVSPLERRPIWYVYTGMGCQWKGMGLQLMEIDVFANSLRRCADVVKPYGCDLFALLQPDTELLFKDRCILNPLVGIVAIQIALTDVLTALNIQPDGILGHSTGEVLAGYADGCTTLEETMYSAYWRGVCIEQSNPARGAMAAIGLTWEESLKRCPKNVFASCHNAEDSVTVSGLEPDVEKFVEQLQKENVFAKMVNANGYSFHCKYAEGAGPGLLAKLKKRIPNPKLRTSRWVSTCYLEEEWNKKECREAGAEYFVHNLISPVRFTEALRKIPPNAITIEIGPHNLLQSIVKRALGSESTNIGLMKRNEANNMKIFFESVGKMYMEGLDPKIENLYPPVKFPVPRGTPRISDLIEWNYSSTFHVNKWEPESGETSHTFNLDKADSYLLDHFIDGRALFPATGYIYLAWEMLASKLQKDFKEFPIRVENFKIHRAVILTKQSTVRFNFNILGDSGHFEISDNHSLVASGQVFEWTNVAFMEPEPTYVSSDSSVSGQDVYNELKMSGYEYKEAFQELLEINMDGTQGLVQWNDRWIPFLDSLLLFFGLVTNSSDFQLPTGALSIKIDPTVLLKKVEEMDDINRRGFPVNYNLDTKVCRTTGVEIVKLETDVAPHRAKDSHPNLEEYKYIPYIYCYVPDKKLELSLLRYMWACNKMLDIVGEKLKKDVKSSKFCVGTDSGISFEEYMETVPENYTLLKCLQDISTNPDDINLNNKQLYTNFSQTIGADALNTIMVSETPLRIMIEILTENTYRKLNVLEVNTSGFALVLPSLVEMAKKYYYFKLKNTVLVTPLDAKLNGKELSENNIQHRSMDSIESFSQEKDQDIVIGSYLGESLSELKGQIQVLSSVVKPTGYILFYVKEKVSPAENFLLKLFGENLHIKTRTEVEKLILESNLVILSKIFDSLNSAVYLLRPNAPLDPHAVIHVKEDNYIWVEDLRKALNGSDGNVWVVAEDSSTNGVIGMINCLKFEPGGERVRCVFISPKKGESKPPRINFEEPFYKNLLVKNLVMNVWRDGSWGSFRHIQLNDQKELKTVEHSYVTCKKFGDLSSFEWIESHVKYASRANEKLVHIYYSALNFKDVMLATGKLSLGTSKSITGQGDNSVLGLEFSGKDESGRRVAGFVSSRGMATSTLVDPNLLIEVPDSWTLEEASTVPVVYATSYYAILVRGQLKRGEKILIHSGTGGIGIAAINIALSLDCEVFTTVGNDSKKKYLRKLFPQIKEENIGCSRNTYFENMIMKRTHGKGVDVVLNSLADDKFLASVRCVAKHGRFVEIGKYDLSLDRSLGLKCFLENISFHGVFLDQLFERNAHNIKVFNHILQLVKDGIKSGVVKPLDRTLFKRDEVEQAFRYMAKGIHVGKVILKIRDEEPDKRALPKTLILPAVPNTYFFTNKYYIIIGGLGGFGMEVTKWILSKGGRNVILTSRYGPRTPYQSLCLRKWNKMGANVQVLTLNVAKRNEAEQLLKEVSKMGPVGGIFNSAVVLKDAFIEQQTPISYDEVCAPKAAATKHLDEFSRKLCSSLDYFICFSSISCGRGNAGQSNYGYANSVMERICEQRRNDGLHGLSVQWGIIGEVGVVHRHMGDDAMMLGVSAQSVKSCLDALDLFCQTDYPVVTSYMAAVSAKKAETQDLMLQISKILGMSGDLTDVAANRSLGEMGIDSLIGVEIRQLLESNFDISLSMQELFEMKISDLQEISNKQTEKEEESHKKPSLLSTTDVKLPATSKNEPLVQLTNIMSGIPVIIVNIGDIDMANFSSLAQTFETPVYGLQWTKSVDATNMEELAKYYLKLIRPKTRDAFHLIGVSEGSSLALEMVKQCDNLKLSVRSCTILDGSENLMKTISKDTSNTDSEVDVILSFAEQFSPNTATKLKKELVKAGTLDRRIKIAADYLASNSDSVNKNEIAIAITELTKKAQILQSYKPKGKLASDVMLIEDPTKVLPNDIAEIKSVIQEVIIGKVVVHRLLSLKDLASKDGVNKLYNILNNEIFSKQII